VAKLKSKPGRNGRPAATRKRSPEELLKSYLEPVRDDARWILGFGEDQARGGLEGHHHLCAKVQKIWEFVTDDGTDSYGKGVIKDLGALYDQGVRGLYEARRFFNQYSLAEVRAFSETPMPNGRWFTWSHVRALLPVRDDAKRKALLKRCLAKGWTSSELAKVVAKELGGHNRAVGAVNAPKDFLGLVAQVKDRTDRWLNDNNTIWSHEEFSLAAQAKKVPLDKITDESLQKVTALRDDLKQLDVQGKARFKEVERALKFLSSHKDG
jgi:hypothetical protein